MNSRTCRPFVLEEFFHFLTFLFKRKWEDDCGNIGAADIPPFVFVKAFSKY